jgi:hypothetical protein
MNVQHRRVYKAVRIYAAGPRHQPEYWTRYIGNVNVNKPCALIFGHVFEQYAVVSLRSLGGDEQRLTRDTNLFSALVMLDILDDADVVVIYAKHHADSD